MSYRIEKDLLGEIRVENKQYYGAQTQRALELCNPSNEKLSCYPDLIESLVLIKKAAARAHVELEVLESKKATAIETACDEILEGKLEGHFPVDIFNGGGGVAVHMNINEVIANRANELITGEKGYSEVHPNTHVNMGQSTNDVLPSAMKLTLYSRLQKVIESLTPLIREISAKEEEFRDVLRL